MFILGCIIMLCQLQRLHLNEGRDWHACEEERTDKETAMVVLLFYHLHGRTR
jgi:hypothetical protein